MTGRKRGGTQPVPLSTADVVAAALQVTRRSGLGGVTIRSVAAELGVTSPAIYHYLSGREELVQRICERVAAQVPLTVRPDLAWDEQIVAIVVAMHRTFAAYPGVGVEVLAMSGPSPSAERIAAQMLDVMQAEGFARNDATDAVATLFFYFSGWLLGRPPFLPGGRAGQVRMTQRLLADGVRFVLTGVAARSAVTRA
ncbi:TetR/AcrR family transcriptional regulator [Humibacter sp.]|uniref:TetR/AcrR family transcriptional regulator n=1 Tax=Humibacter sp. TaxID=1940291 RepID=UPI002C231B95|nr:TetR/AcrR family transcriptional regulator [Humibacter sp.]HVX07199.1 TetR/AcrR family transcriptional regulator [Humibacter sp.]